MVQCSDGAVQCSDGAVFLLHDIDTAARGSILSPAEGGIDTAKGYRDRDGAGMEAWCRVICHHQHKLFTKYCGVHSKTHTRRRRKREIRNE